MAVQQPKRTSYRNKCGQRHHNCSNENDYRLSQNKGYSGKYNHAGLCKLGQVGVYTRDITCRRDWCLHYVHLLPKKELKNAFIPITNSCQVQFTKWTYFINKLN